MEYDELVTKFTSRYDFLNDIPKKDKDRYPPWAIRKYIEMSGALLHPDLSAELRVLSACTYESVYVNRNVLQSYFAWSYNLTTETSYSIVMYFSGEDFSILSPFSQLDGITFHKADLEGPTSNPEEFDIDAISETTRKDINRNNEPVLLRIGKSAHKSDLAWFVKKYWKDIEPLIERPEADSKQIRPRGEAERNIKEYAMRRKKISTDERIGAHKISGRPLPDYDTFNAGYKQIKPRAKKNTYDLFSIIHEQLSQSLTHHHGTNTYILCLDDSGETPYLYLEHA